MNKKALHLGLAFLFALIAGGAASLAYHNRDSLFEWDWVEPVGSFTEKEDPALRAAAMKHIQEKLARPGEVCVDQWVGRDDRYLYMSVGCAKFTETMGEIHTSGDSNFHATRFRYSDKEITGFEQPKESDFANSIRRLFPKHAAHLLNVRMNQEIFRRLGLEKSGSLR